MSIFTPLNKRPINPSLLISLIPIGALLTVLVTAIILIGATAIQDYSYYILTGAALLCFLLGHFFTRRQRAFLPGFIKSARQILPAIPILIFIGTLSSTWMLSGVVPLMIEYGLHLLDIKTFLVVSCMLCAMISVISGSSWTTIATIGVALISVGSVMGYHPGWVAGAIISGAYFGDKVSPLSDTTVLAASSCGVPLFTHIRFLMLTSLPALAIALIVYTVVGFTSNLTTPGDAEALTSAINSHFNTTPLILIIPAITILLLLLRVKTVWTLAGGSIAGLVGIWVFQPQIVELLSTTYGSEMSAALHIIFSDTALATGNVILDPLIATGGIKGMLPTVWLVLSAMLFGGAMLGTGMLGTITHAITSRIHRSRHLVGATVGTGLFLNSCTGDQYLSIIIGGNVYRNTYRKRRLKPQTLSRTLEDSVSVTSVLIPWNSCGVTQSTVLGVSTMVYAPFCIFNILSPIMSLVMAWGGWHIRRQPTTAPST